MKKSTLALTSLTLASLLLTGCGAGSSSHSSSAEGQLKVVTTTDVYADLVTAVAGDRVEVQPIISSTAVDPHSYEATSQDRLTVKDAKLVLINGGGYDHFLEEMAGSDNQNQAVLKAVEVSGLFSQEDLDHMAEEHSGDHSDHNHVHSYNEHVWYDIDSMQKLVDQLAQKLSELDPEGAKGYSSRAADYQQKLQGLKDRLTTLATQEGKYLATESVPAYLLEDAGLADITPSDLLAAVDSESDIAPLTMQETKDVISSGQARLLAFNEQTQTKQTEEIRSFAQEASLPAVSFTETLPEGKDYLTWMGDNISAIEETRA